MRLKCRPSGFSLVVIMACFGCAAPQVADPPVRAARTAASPPCSATPAADPGAREASGRAHLQAGELAPAKSDFDGCIAIDGRRAACLMGLADIALRERNDGEALSLLTRAALATPTAAKPYLVLADTYLRLRLPAQAEQVLREAKRLTPVLGAGRFELFALAAQAFLDRGDVSGAISELEAARSELPPKAPEQLELLYSLGSLYATSTPPRKALALDNLRAFHARACNGAAPAKLASECELARQLVRQLGESL